MPDLHLRIRKLCEQINKEHDQDHLLALVRELNELIGERAKRIREGAR